MKFEVFVYVLASLIQAQSYAAKSNLTIAAFCKNKPVGLYCNPETFYQKVECPSGAIYTCPKGASEFCQERGILNSSGYRGGVARCVPFITAQSLESFCKNRQTGVFCYGDKLNNVRVQCPSKLIYKCDDNPTEDTKKCVQKSPLFATCEEGGSNSGGNPTPSICSVQTVTSTSTMRPRTITRPRATTTVTESCSRVVTSVQYSTTVIDSHTSAPITQVSSTTGTALSTLTYVSVIPETTVAATSSVTYRTNTFYSTNVDSSTMVYTSTVGVDSTTVAQVSTTAGAAGTSVVSVITIEPPVSTSSCTESSKTKTRKTRTRTTTAGAVNTGTPTLITVSTSCTTTTESGGAVNTGRPPVTTLIATTTTQGGGAGAGSNPTPSVSACPIEGGLQTTITTPNQRTFRYVLTSKFSSETDAQNACASLGGKLALINTSNEHWYLGQQVCAPIWYRNWEGNTYSNPNACIALYPGGASAVPVNGCSQLLQGLCTVPV